MDSDHHWETCPACRGYRLESSWCGFCERTGMVKVPNKPVPMSASELAERIERGERWKIAGGGKYGDPRPMTDDDRKQLRDLLDKGYSPS